MTDAILKLFVSKVDTRISYSNRELQKILSDSYKELNKTTKPVVVGDKPRKDRKKRERDENGEIIKKRAPSAYNLFVKDASAKIRAENPGMDSKSVFKLAIEEWNKSKGDKNNNTTANEATDSDTTDDNKPEVKTDEEDKEEEVDVVVATVEPVKAKKSRKPNKANDDE